MKRDGKKEIQWRMDDDGNGLGKMTMLAHAR
jgi:hypothetical protein